MTQQPSFEQIFELYLDINTIKLDRHEQIMNVIVSKHYDQVLTYHRLGYVVYYFDQFVRGEISQEQFLALGDVAGLLEDQINPHRYREEHPAKLDILTPEIVAGWTEDDLIVVDELFVVFYRSQHGDFPTGDNIMIIG